MNTDPLAEVLAESRAGREVFHTRLKTYLSCQSVSTDPAYAEGMAAARSFLTDLLTGMGFSGIRELDGGVDGHPALYAEWLKADGAPTMLIYGHYDVQPPDPLDRWTTPPFDMQERDGRLYARGISDDKGPTLIALEAMRAYIAVQDRLPLNVKILLEGEEETGSPSLPNILKRNADLLSADAILSADGARWRSDLTAVNVGSRGNGGLEFSLRTADLDLHSGRYGGAVPNALHEMARVIAALHDADNRVTVPGFYDDIVMPDAATEADLHAIPFDGAAWAGAVGAAEQGESGYTTLQRLWDRPTLEVNGMWGGYQGAGSKTVIPNEAHAKITMRLVQGQKPEAIRDAVKAHIAALVPPGIELTFTADRGWTKAYAVPGAHPLLLAAEEALFETFGQKPVRVRIGATLPLSDLVARELGIDTIMFSFSTADEQFHAPNEFLRVSAIDDGIRAWITILDRIGKQSPDQYLPYRQK
ncbi:M20 family dipeptidase [Hwanghaeella grinnelliae]|uniref:M20 family dipeptidase n=1 Tax=Hwanghaeella grinnelliae TaxID=2500179 RepID=A0A437QVT1_9PROT|nr:M20/M25/M40 family metallo-hydrolase [Hwanghaeella grinnelliae]RVU38625.1 M20 family dipeptidase [Hwanghaeella grinnelliae]